MLRTRLWMGACLIILTVAMLVYDGSFGPWYPFLLLFFLVLSMLASLELVGLLGPEHLPPRWFCAAGVLLVVLANWPAHLLILPFKSLELVLLAFATVVLAAFIVEMVRFHEPGESVPRLAHVAWLTAYVGVLPSFLAQLRWPRLEGGADERGASALALAIFLPKACDIGAYFSGRLLGRHRMTPLLSPGKTWEGFAGGMIVAAAFAFAFNSRWPVLGPEPWRAVGFGLTVGLAAVIGDLAESLIKRDCRRKDASQVVPGFGGVLDVIDSVVFAAPLAYLWLNACA